MQIKVKMLIAGAVLLCGGLAADVSAQVYKCQSGGRTAYQDKPCDGAAGQAGRATSASFAAPAPVLTDARSVMPAGDLAGLARQIRASEAEERRLDTQYRQDVEALRARAVNMSVADADREVRALNARHQQRMQGASAQREALIGELRRRCPNGAVLNERTQRCN